MPRLPTVPQQNLATPQGPAFQAPNVVPMQNATGRQFQQLGQGIEEAGRGLASVGFQMQDEESIARITQANNLLADTIRDEMQDPQKGYLSTVGENASQERRKATFDSIKERTTILRNGLKTEQQRRKFDEIVSSRLQDATRDADRHDVRQRLVFRMGQTEASVASYMQDAISSVGTEDFEFNRDMMVSSAVEVVKLRGGGPEERQQARMEALTKMHATIINGMLAVDDPARALNYYADNESEIDKSVAAQLRNKITQEGERIKRLAKVDESDTKAWTYATNLIESGASYAEIRSAIDQSVATKRMDGETAMKTLRFIDYDKDQKWQEQQRSRSDLAIKVGQLFSKNPDMTVELLPSEVRDQAETLGISSRLVEIRREARSRYIAGLIEDSKSIDDVLMASDYADLRQLRLLADHLTERVDSIGIDPATKKQVPLTQKMLETKTRMQKQIEILDQRMDSILSRPRTFVSRGEATKQEEVAPEPIDLKKIIESLRGALYPNGKR